MYRYYDVPAQRTHEGKSINDVASHERDLKAERKVITKVARARKTVHFEYSQINIDIKKNFQYKIFS